MRFTCSWVGQSAGCNSVHKSSSWCGWCADVLVLLKSWCSLTIVFFFFLGDRVTLMFRLIELLSSLFLFFTEWLHVFFTKFRFKPRLSYSTSDAYIQQLRSLHVEDLGIVPPSQPALHQLRFFLAFLSWHRQDRKGKVWPPTRERKGASVNTSAPSANGSGWAATAGQTWDKNA